MDDKLVITVEVQIHKPNRDYRIRDISTIVETRMEVPMALAEILADTIANTTGELYREAYKQILIGIRDSEEATE